MSFLRCMQHPTRVPDYLTIGKLHKGHPILSNRTGSESITKQMAGKETPRRPVLPKQFYFFLVVAFAAAFFAPACLVGVAFTLGLTTSVPGTSNVAPAGTNQISVSISGSLPVRA